MAPYYSTKPQEAEADTRPTTVSTDYRSAPGSSRGNRRNPYVESASQVGDTAVEAPGVHERGDGESSADAAETLRRCRCAVGFQEERLRMARVRAVHGKPFECPQCATQFPRKCDLEKHALVAHGGRRPWVCSEPACVQAFWKKQHLVRHVRAVHGEMKLVGCEECSAVSARSEHLGGHVQSVYRDETGFDCLLCDARFLDMRAFRAHLRGFHKIVQQWRVESFANWRSWFEEALISPEEVSSP